ncbi:ATP-binding protein [Uliginosibacterium sp. sgz301328]|uniref:sensor histidine kinase n=1 Tax=Uliginosibacterium sp. sgz301328 TaxID=3243764 RepID=UPI00359E8D1F
MDAQSDTDFQPGEVALDDVIATSILRTRPIRAPDYAVENAALTALADTLAESPSQVAQCLVDKARELTGAHSAGLSLLENDTAAPHFRWIAIAGEYARYLNGTLPRNFSPCGTVLDRGEALLMRSPERHFPYVGRLHAPVREVLLAPFRRGGSLAGTVWVVSHVDGKGFDMEDLRVLTSLSRFAAAAVQTAMLIDDLRDADRRKDEFLATLAHELRNPLMPLRLASQVLRHIEPGDHARMYSSLDIIDRQNALLSALVSDLMDAASIRSGKLSLHCQPVTVQEVFARALETSQPQIEARRHRLEVQIPDQLIVLNGDIVRLTQALSNLLNNAARYTPVGGCITLAVAAEADGVSITVTDNGEGITPEAMATIFNMFAQAPGAEKRPHGGLGIGLALVRRIAELHGGRLEAFSEGPGQGSTFTFWLPRAD